MVFPYSVVLGTRELFVSIGVKPLVSTLEAWLSLEELLDATLEEVDSYVRSDRKSSRKAVKSASKELEELLDAATGSMNRAQRARFEMLRNNFSKN